MDYFSIFDKNFSLSSIYKYIQKYQQEGEEGLVLRHAPGRTSFLTDEQKDKVVALVMNKTPEDVGFPAEMNWTSPLIASGVFSIVIGERETYCTP